MSFQAYLDTIAKQTGLSPEAIHDKAQKAGILTPTITATIFCGWLAKELKLGRGHSMALWKYFIEKHWIQPQKTKIQSTKRRV